MAVVSQGWEGGRRKRKYYYGATQAEVQAKLDEAKNDIREFRPLPNERTLTGDFLEQWLLEFVKPNARPRTYAGYCDIVRLHLKPQLGHIPLTKLSPLDVQRLINRKVQEKNRVKNMTDKNLSGRTVRYIHAVLRSALNRAVAWHLVKRNAALGIKLPKPVRPRIRPLDLDQAKALLEAVKGDRLEALYSVALALGLREGEVLGLRWENIDLDAGTLRVEKSLQLISKKLVLAPLKTDESRRTLALPAFAVASLRSHRIAQKKERLVAADRWKGGEPFVFCTGIGTPIFPRNLRRQFRSVLTNANLPRVRFHDLRHTAGTLLAAQGVSPRVIMEILGHTQVSMTMNVYVHATDAMQVEAAQRIDRALQGTQLRT
jgi:integrase